MYTRNWSQKASNLPDLGWQVNLRKFNHTRFQVPAKVLLLVRQPLFPLQMYQKSYHPSIFCTHSSVHSCWSTFVRVWYWCKKSFLISLVEYSLCSSLSFVISCDTFDSLTAPTSVYLCASFMFSFFWSRYSSYNNICMALVMPSVRDRNSVYSLFVSHSVDKFLLKLWICWSSLELVILGSFIFFLRQSL